MRKSFAGRAIVILSLLVLALFPAVLMAQEKKPNDIGQSLEDAFLGANPEKVKAAREKAAETAALESQKRARLSDSERLGALKDDARIKVVRNAEALKSGNRPYIIAVYNTRTAVSPKPSRIAWEKISGVVAAGDAPEAVVSSPGSVFDINGSSYILAEAENGIVLTFVSSGRKNTIVIGTMEGSFITADGYVCRVKRYQEG